eukprot:146117-Hanusia_phi.AAC.6
MLGRWTRGSRRWRQVHEEEEREDEEGEDEESEGGGGRYPRVSSRGAGEGSVRGTVPLLLYHPTLTFWQHETKSEGYTGAWGWGSPSVSVGASIS